MELLSRSRRWTLASLLIAITGCAPSEPHRAEAPPRSTRGPTAPSAPEPAPSIDRNSDGSPKRLPPGPPALPGHTLVLAYDDLGPQAMSFGLIGMGWWQWAECACFEPGDVFDVRVVVYRGLSLAEIERRYPTIKDRADYRYVEYDAVLAYIDDNIAWLSGDPDLVKLRAELTQTRARIVAALDAAPSPPPRH